MDRDPSTRHRRWTLARVRRETVVAMRLQAQARRWMACRTVALRRAQLAERRKAAAVRVQSRVRGWRAGRERRRELLMATRLQAAARRWIAAADERWQREHVARYEIAEEPVWLVEAEKVLRQVGEAEQKAEQWQQVQGWLEENARQGLPTHEGRPRVGRGVLRERLWEQLRDETLAGVQLGKRLAVQEREEREQRRKDGALERAQRRKDRAGALTIQSYARRWLARATVAGGGGRRVRAGGR